MKGHLAEVKVDMDGILSRPDETNSQQLSSGFAQELALCHQSLAISPSSAGRDVDG